MYKIIQTVVKNSTYIPTAKISGKVKDLIKLRSKRRNRFELKTVSGKKYINQRMQYSSNY